MMETVHGSTGVGVIYTAGVLAGSLGYFIFGKYSNLIGGSAGCYALIGAQLGCVLLNWSEENAIIIRRARRNRKPHVFNGKLVRILKVLGLFLFILLDVVNDVTTSDSSISIIAHVFGFIGGFLTGLLVVKNRKIETWERRFKIIVTVATLVYYLSGIIANITIYHLK